MNNRLQIEQQVKEWAADNIGCSFVFRQHQLEAIVDTIHNILYGDYTTHIVEAPTGSGKSLILIISAGVLEHYYHKTSYILCSDLYLWKQYDDFINKYPKIDDKIGRLKGQTGNYVCIRNNEDTRNAECRIAKMSWSKLYNKDAAAQCGFDCAAKCPYVKARKKAQHSKITLMTYQLYLYVINVVRQGVEKPPFGQRDVIFCDECHNIPNIISGQYTPSVSEALLDKFVALYEYNQSQCNIGECLDLFDSESVELENLNAHWKSASDLKRAFHRIYNKMVQPSSNEESYRQIMQYLEVIVFPFQDTVELLEENLRLQHSDIGLTADITKMYKLTSWYRNYCCFCNDFATAVNDCGPEYIVKVINETRKTNKNGEIEIFKTANFKCAKEDYMCYAYLMNTSEHHVLTSATIGLKESFIDNIGLKYMTITTPKVDKIPSTFDFTKSPVIYFPKYKMSYNYKDSSFPRIKDITYNIIRKHSGTRGLIQTGSYDNAVKVYQNAPDDVKRRLLLYNNSGEKSEAIDTHRLSDDTVLIGPSLNEGIDLPDDMCRFIVVMKVPYPSLTDELVKAKMNIFPLWYNSETSNHIIQGIGRGNRHADDWCITYILDGCFGQLYKSTAEQYPIELKNRIKVYNK